MGIMTTRGEWGGGFKKAPPPPPPHSPLKIFAHPDIFSNRFAIDPGGNLRYIGIYWSQQYLEGLGAQFQFHEDPVEISEGVWFSGEIPRGLGFEGRSPRFRREIDGYLIEDVIPDDAALFLKTSEGLVILVGCCHSGLLNTIDYAIRITGEGRIRLVIGGTHLSGYPIDLLDELFRRLEEYEVEEFRLSHCTGMIPFAELYKRFPDKSRPTRSGEVIGIG